VNSRCDTGRERKDHDQQQHQRQNHYRPRQLLPTLGVDLRYYGKAGNAHDHADQLPNEQVRLTMAGLHFHDRARAIDSRQSESEKNPSQDYESARLGPHLPAHGNVCGRVHQPSFVASFLNRSPLSS